MKKRRRLGSLKMEYPVSKTRVCQIVRNPSGSAVVGLDEVQQCARACGSSWFEKGEMRFFGTRLDHRAFVDGRGGAFFVTSEKRPGSGTSEPRRFSVRHYANCSIDTVGDFQRFKTKAQALKAAKHFAEDSALHGTRKRKRRK